MNRAPTIAKSSSKSGTTARSAIKLVARSGQTAAGNRTSNETETTDDRHPLEKLLFTRNAKLPEKNTQNTGEFAQGGDHPNSETTTYSGSNSRIRQGTASLINGWNKYSHSSAPVGGTGSGGGGGGSYGSVGGGSISAGGSVIASLKKGGAHNGRAEASKTETRSGNAFNQGSNGDLNHNLNRQGHGGSHGGQIAKMVGEVKLDEKDKGNADFANWNTTKSEAPGLMGKNGNDLSVYIMEKFVNGNQSLGEAFNNANGAHLTDYYDHNGSRYELTMTTGEKKLPDNFGTKENPAQVAFILASTGGASDGHMFGADVRNSKAIAKKAGVKEENIHVIKDFDDFLKKRDEIIAANKDSAKNGDNGIFKNALVFQFNHGNLEGRDVSNPGGDGSHNLKDKSYCV